MSKVIGVRFRQAGKIYHFSPGRLDIKINDKIIVETIRGKELGTVVVGVKDIEYNNSAEPLKTIERIATIEDLQSERENKNREQDAIEICREKVRAHNLQMKIIQAEFTFDNSKVLFYFTADGRIDFRELVKDLASVFRTRIELRQIGVRDETKIRGGIGICGRELCCNKYLTDFSPVSIKMAKDQNISLNPTKISGVCGRLMCCLSNEEATYEDLNGNLPAIGAKVETIDGKKGEVISVAILRQLVKVMFIGKAGEKEFIEMKVDELKFQGTRKQQLNEQNHRIDDSVAKILREDHVDSDKDKKNNKNRHNKYNGKNDKDNSGYKKREYKGNKPFKDGNDNKTNKINESKDGTMKNKSSHNNHGSHAKNSGKPHTNDEHKNKYQTVKKTNEKSVTERNTKPNEKEVREKSHNDKRSNVRNHNDRKLGDKNNKDRNNARNTSRSSNNKISNTDK